MRRAQPILLCLLAAMLLLQSAAAMAHCLRHVSGGWLVELCSSGDRHLVLVDADGQEIPPADDLAFVFCPACHALPAIALPQSPLASEPLAYAVRVAWAVTAETARRPPARAPPYPGRAPPLPA